MAAGAAPRCTRYGSERIVKNGRNVCGQQQFRCRTCGACRVFFSKSRSTPPARQREILRAMALDRLSLRAAARLWRGTADAHGLAQKKPKACRR